MKDFANPGIPASAGRCAEHEGKNEDTMIHHVSFSARDPRHVAEVLAELMCGRAYPFPGSIPDSWMAVSGDACGTMVEVYPQDIALEPGQADDEQVVALRNQSAPNSVPFHFLLSVPVDHGTIERIGKREGWRTRLYGRGALGQKPLFHVVEFWIENRLMLELAPEDMMDGYLDLMQLPVLDKFFGYEEAA